MLLWQKLQGVPETLDQKSGVRHPAPLSETGKPDREAHPHRSVIVGGLCDRPCPSSTRTQGTPEAAQIMGCQGRKGHKGILTAHFFSATLTRGTLGTHLAQAGADY